ncbi:MAG: DUF349 domain-containing protein, partial [Candidatus Symbiothrix sp.]|nr:DUF349 domain-containing protein [Candidatus Symbiothrix sp.]
MSETVILPVTEEPTETVETAVGTSEVVSETEQLNKEEIIKRLSDAVSQEMGEATKNTVDALKQAFYKLKRIETELLKKAFTDTGNPEEDFKPEEDPL